MRLPIPSSSLHSISKKLPVSSSKILQSSLTGSAHRSASYRLNFYTFLTSMILAFFFELTTSFSSTQWLVSLQFLSSQEANLFTITSLHLLFPFLDLVHTLSSLFPPHPSINPSTRVVNQLQCRNKW